MILWMGLWLSAHPVYGQKQGNIWYFGFNAGVDFNSGSPEPLFDGKISTDEGCATISDNDGQLLFYTDGITVWNHQHEMMPNGQDLAGDPSSTQSGVIVPHPGDQNLYYIFTVDNNVGAGGMKYSLVDLRLEDGLGDVVEAEKNISLLNPSTERITAVQHQNRRDVWVIAHGWNSNDFYIYKVGVNGLNLEPNIQSIGLIHSGGIFHTHGYLKASPDGSKIAIAMGEREVCQVFDFDSVTGALSNPISIDPNRYVYGVEFAPDNSRVYLSFRYDLDIFQYNLEAGDEVAIQDSEFTIPTNFTIGALQLGPDGKIYVTKYSPFLGVINNPNALGEEVDFIEDAINLEPGYASLGLPTFVQSFFRSNSFSFLGTCVGDTTHFLLDAPDQIQAVSWNFGDSLAGIRNLSNELNPKHIYKVPGTYMVQAEVVLNDGTNQSFTQTLKIADRAPLINLSADTLLCPGQILELDVSQEGTATYIWQGNPELNSPIFLIDSAGTYTLEIFNDCGVVRDTIRVDYVEDNLQLPKPRLLCPGETPTLDASLPYEGARYQWNTGATEPTILVNRSGVYEVTISLPNGCQISQKTQFDYIDSLQIRQSSDSLGVVVCRRENVILNIEPDIRPYLEHQAVEFLWKNGSDSLTTTVSSLDSLIDGDSDLFWVVVSTEECAGFAQSKITFLPEFPPESNLPDSMELCFGDTLAIDARTPDGLAYEWSRLLADTANPTFLSNDPILRTPEEGVYTVRIEGPACAKYDTVNVYYEFSPRVFVADATLCVGEPVTLRALYQNISPNPPLYLWDDGSTQETRSVDSPGLYFVTISNNCGSITDTVEVTLDNTPSPQVNLGNDTTLCPGETLLLDASNPGSGYNYIWQDGSRRSTYTVVNPGTYQVQIKTACEEISDEITVNYLSPPRIQFNPQVYLCSEDTLTLNAANPDASYLWKDAQDNILSTDSSLQVFEPGQYTVSISNTCGTQTFSTQVSTLERTIDLGEDLYVCEVDTVILGKELIDAAYRWQDGSQQAQLAVTESGTYWRSVSIDGCQLSDTIQVFFLSDLALDFGDNRFICNGEALRLSATSPLAQYRWFNGLGELISTDSVLIVEEAGAYSVEVDNGCKRILEGIDVLEANLTLDLGADIFACEGESIRLNTQVNDPNTTYLWSNGSNQSAIQVDSSGIYWVEAVLSNCRLRDSVEVTFLSTPPIDIGSDTTLCPQSVYILDATAPNSTYRWQDGSTAATFAVTQAGMYSVEVDNGCSTNFQEVFIDYFVSPRVDFGEDQVLCPGTSLLLDATNPNASYEWQDGSTAATFTVTQAGTYSVTVRANGCTIQEEINISYREPLSPIDLGADQIVCPQSVITLDAQSNDPEAVYQWSDGSNQATLQVTRPGTYWVQISNACEIQRDTLIIDYYSFPQVDLGADLLLCPGELVALDATNPNATYQWQDGSTNPIITVNQGGLYWVEVTADNGCIIRDSIQVTYKTALELELGENQTLCEGETLTLNASNPFSQYIWQDGSQEPTFTVRQAGTYSVWLSNGCDTLQDEITIDYTPLPQVNLGNDTILCFSEQILLDASNENVTYLWQDGSREATFLVSTEGQYWVELTRENCTIREEILIAFAECVDEVEIPNVITPNGDQVNDFFIIDKLDLSQWILNIYNRNGLKVYQSSNYQNDWNGGDNPPGVYFYVFKQKRGGQFFKGWLEILK